VLGAVLRVHHLGTVQVRTTDEQVYPLYAYRLATEGITSLPLQHRQHLTHGNFELPPPTRWGLPMMAAMLVPVAPSRTTAVAWVSVAASVVGLAVVGLLGRRFLGRWEAVLAVSFLSIFPPDLAIARRGGRMPWLRACHTGQCTRHCLQPRDPPGVQ
jgi:hypothetical protein